MYVISDVHGDYDGLVAMLDTIDENDFVLQIGDLANCVSESVDGDLKCLDLVGTRTSAMLIGNHEIPYFDSQNVFSGFHYNAQIRGKLHDLYENQLLLSSFVYEGTLISHAGITQQQLNLGTGVTAREVNNKLEQEWFEGNFGHYLFRDVGRARYGNANIGGVLWCDFDEEFAPTEFPQIVGHTTGSTVRLKGNAICIDTQGDVRNSDHRCPTIIKL